MRDFRTQGRAYELRNEKIAGQIHESITRERERSFATAGPD